MEFSIGWIEVSKKRKNVKSGHSKQAPKGSKAVARNDGAGFTKEHKKGTWTRLPCRPNNEQMLMDKVENIGPKRKAEGGGSAEGVFLKMKRSRKLMMKQKDLVFYLLHNWDRRRLLGNPAGSNESLKLELSRAWEPSDS